MRRLLLGAACLIALVSAAVASAEETSEALLLRYHFQPGQEFHYRLTLNGDMGMSFGGMPVPAGANVPGRIPMTMNWLYEFSQKVKSVTPEGAASISTSIDKMEMTTQMMGMNIVGRLGADGKMETLMNGQPMTLPNMPNVTITNPIGDTTIEPTGKIVGIDPGASKTLNQLFGGQNIASMFNGMPGMGGLILPTQAVKPGDVWDQKFDLRMPLPMPGMAAAGPGALPAGTTLAMNFLMHNKLLRVEAGHAVIETQMTATMPAASKIPVPSPAGANVPAGMKVSIDKMVETMTGTQRFNTEQGAIDDGDFTATMDMAMAIGVPASLMGAPGAATPPAKAKTAAKKRPAARKTASARPRSPTPAPAAGAAPAPFTMKMTMGGTMKMKVERLAAAEPAPAPPAAP